MDGGTISAALRIDHDRNMVKQHDNATVPQICPKWIPNLGGICVKVSARKRKAA